MFSFDAIFKFKKITIKKKLKKDGFKPLTKNSKYWDEMAKAYINQHYKPKFIHAGMMNTEKEIAGKLQYKTKKVLKKTYEEQNKDLYWKTKQWCVIPITVEKRAKKMGFSFLNNCESDNKDDEIWKIRILDYRAYKEEADISHFLDKETNMNEKIKVIKKLSREFLNKKNYDPNIDEFWNTSIRWFTKNRP